MSGTTLAEQNPSTNRSVAKASIASGADSKTALEQITRGVVRKGWNLWLGLLGQPNKIKPKAGPESCYANGDQKCGDYQLDCFGIFGRQPAAWHVR